MLHPPLEVRVVDLDLDVPRRWLLGWGHSRIEGVVQDDRLRREQEAVDEFGQVLKVRRLGVEDLRAGL